MIVNIDKGLLKAVKWLLKATTKDPARPVLQGVNANGHLEACDGLRYHAVNTSMYAYGETPADAVHDPTDVQLVGLYHIDQPKVGFNVIQHNDSHFPEMDRLIPHKQPVFEIGVDPKLLAEACAGLDAPVKLSFYAADEPFEVRGYLSDEYATYCLVMPHELKGFDRTWTPYQKKEG
jgi:hypothetical protein